jgi:hypothetical protein
LARLIFPVPVFLNRLEAPLCVFILGIIVIRGPCLSKGQIFLYPQKYFTLTPLRDVLRLMGQLAAVLQIGGTVSSFV